ncbi:MULTISPECIES: hypothetical protein [Cupriavidus]
MLVFTLSAVLPAFTGNLVPDSVAEHFTQVIDTLRLRSTGEVADAH